MRLAASATGHVEQRIPGVLNRALSLRWVWEVGLHLAWTSGAVAGVLLAVWAQGLWSGAGGTGVVAVWHVLGWVELLWPVCLGAAVAWTQWRWVREGTWLQLRAWGVRGRGLIRLAVACGVVGLGMGLLLCHQWGPECRSSARQAQAWEAWPKGGPTQIGDWTVWPSSAEGAVAAEVYIRRDGMQIWAERGELVRSEQGTAVHLERGRVALDAGPSLTFDAWTQPVNPRGVRIQLNERSTPDLARVAQKTAQSGGAAAYEWAVWYKRWTWPLVALLVPWALLPWASGPRAARGTAAVLLGALLMVRVGDGLVPALGPAWASGAAPGWVAALGALGWWRWRDR